MADAVRLQLGAWEEVREAAARIRFIVFVEEQKVPAEIELDEWDAQVSQLSEAPNELIALDPIAEFDPEQSRFHMVGRGHPPQECRSRHDEDAPRPLLGQLGEHGHTLHLGPTVRYDVEKRARVRGGEEKNVAVIVGEEKPKVRLVAIGFLEVRSYEYEAAL